MVIIDTVINTVLGGLTLDPAGMHCPAGDDAFVSSYNYTQFCPISGPKSSQVVFTITLEDADKLTSNSASGIGDMSLTRI